MEPVGDLLSNQGGVAAGSVVDDQINPSLIFYGLVYDFCRSSIISGSSIQLTILSNGKVIKGGLKL